MPGALPVTFATIKGCRSWIGPAYGLASGGPARTQCMQEHEAVEHYRLDSVCAVAAASCCCSCCLLLIDQLLTLAASHSEPGAVQLLRRRLWLAESCSAFTARHANLLQPLSGRPCESTCETLLQVSRLCGLRG